jgi:hypothetical protein
MSDPSIYETPTRTKVIPFGSGGSGGSSPPGAWGQCLVYEYTDLNSALDYIHRESVMEDSEFTRRLRLEIIPKLRPRGDK